MDFGIDVKISFSKSGLENARPGNNITLLRMQWLEMLLQAKHKGIGNALAGQSLRRSLMIMLESTHENAPIGICGIWTSELG